MEPMAWLETTAPGFDQLTTEERNAIRDFAMLWSLYEGAVLNSSAHANSIIAAVNSIQQRGRLNIIPIRPAIEYFVARYFDGNDLTHAYNMLLLRQNDRPDLVEKVVRKQCQNDAEMLSAVLIIVLRLRNNLFHGIKWSYGIKDQLQNFQNANHVLMAVMEMHA